MREARVNQCNIRSLNCLRAITGKRQVSADAVGVIGVYEPQQGFEAKQQVPMVRVVGRPSPAGQVHVPLHVVNLLVNLVNLDEGQHVGSLCLMAGACNFDSVPVRTYTEICQRQWYSNQENSKQGDCSLVSPLAS